MSRWLGKALLAGLAAAALHGAWAQNAPARRVLARLADAAACTPAYPPESLAAGEEGSTEVWLRIAADGRVLDASVSRCRFLPGTFDGQPLESATTVRFQWRIEERLRLPEGCVPEYPQASTLAAEQGTTRLRVWLAADGRLERAEVASSSGHARLDQAALASIATCRFTLPATNEARAPAYVDYVWRLEPD